MNPNNNEIYTIKINGIAKTNSNTHHHIVYKPVKYIIRPEVDIDNINVIISYIMFFPQNSN